MIETIYPTLKVDASELQPPEIVFGGDTSEDIRKNLSGRMSEATHMLMRWRKSHCSQLKMENGGQQKGTTDCTKLPPTILLRSVEDMPLEWKTLGCGPREQLLGWQEYRTDFFQNVISVPGNHYTIFDEENMPRMLSALREACESVVRVVR
ncbi:hypothetical protein COCSADRAFT_42068 [Bipolaris sorokiniana ND90Pr]|uniref:Thioesterase domain-containing protein n=1 Tax=Cochliobolus sativus (strain ND90Pr / ATCC 201652) TaxID=665912 RepID=M2SM44_COCSN|nr:uncharacterized protein COCSADRAFT_42068 [Bipolaris sorokiniana ND90Pr]EMD58216.1 hypothetical protein COCSADRAFT_42068 [Bipolaris sorokiniana ND90Pr]